MNAGLAAAALVSAILGIGHSVAGERMLLRPLFAADLPRFMGSAGGMRRTLRFTWHLVTLLLVGVGAAFGVLAFTTLDDGGRLAARVLGTTMLVAGGAALVASRGRHPFWVGATLAGASAWLGAGAA